VGCGAVPVQACREEVRTKGTVIGLHTSVWGRPGVPPSPFVFWEICMNLSIVLRYVILAISGAAMVLGVLVMMGELVPTTMPDQFTTLLGAVIFLYGAYRFAIAYFQRPKD
jgi:hypothetical protein